MNSPRTLTLAVIAAHWMGSLLAWPGLPGRAAPAAPRPDVPGWGEVTSLNWFGLPAFSMGLILIVWAVAAWLSRYPLFMGVASKGRFRRLPASARRRVLRGVREGLELAGLPIAFVFLFVQIGIFEALSGRTSLPWTLGGLVLSLVAFSALPAFLQRRVEEAVEREWKEVGATGISG
jgi:hypothetical protein